MDFNYTILFLLGSAIFFLLGWLELLPFTGRSKNLKMLKSNGTPVVTNIDQIKKNSDRKKRLFWVIYSHWENPETGKYYLFKSPKLEFDPSIYLEPGLVTVLVDAANPSKYLFDVQDLRTRAGL